MTPNQSPLDRLKAAVNAIGMVCSEHCLVYEPFLSGGNRLLRRGECSIIDLNGTDLSPDQREFAEKQFELLERKAKHKAEANEAGFALDKHGTRWNPKLLSQARAREELSSFDPDQQAFLEAAWAKMERPKRKVWVQGPGLDMLNILWHSGAETLADVEAIYAPLNFGKLRPLAAKLGIPLFTSREELERWAGE
jgi:hypothetical protein